MIGARQKSDTLVVPQNPELVLPQNPFAPPRNPFAPDLRDPL
mgnify:CR=1 FL=1